MLRVLSVAAYGAVWAVIAVGLFFLFWPLGLIAAWAGSLLTLIAWEAESPPQQGRHQYRQRKP